VACKVGVRWAAALGVLLLTLATAWLVHPSAVSALATPSAVPGRHLGVASCAGSTCHGRQEPTGAIVRQDEILHWQDPSSPGGAHSRAWRVLAGARGRSIAARLGIGNPQSAPMCLGCHADPTAAGGPLPQLSDGVGCEGCHGNASGWIASHYAVGASHAANVARGMVPLDDPRARANRCLDCHFGSARAGQFTFHRIMAAGHPRIAFELDLFSTLERHWNEDADYAQRKRQPSAIRTWAVGQAEALNRALTLFADPGRRREGMFPEFYFFDCQTCHRRISDDPDYRPTALANPGRSIPPGMPAFQDENMIMLAAAAKVAAPDLAGRLDNDSRAFHAAIAENEGAAVAAAARLRGTAEALSARFAGASLGPRETFAIIDAVATTAAARYTDYEGSAQAVMAIDTLLSSLVASGSVSDQAAAAIRPDINRAYQAVKDPNGYQPLVFRDSLAHAARAIGALK
jgi:hypothetical protein